MQECLAIKPDLVFLWDEAWFGFARFNAFHRRRTAMAAAATLSARYRDPAYKAQYKAAAAKFGAIEPGNEKLLNTPLLPDPDKVRIRVYQTCSTHKSMSALRQGSMMLVWDDDFHHVEGCFQEAFLTHTSTSPNQQIIASLDVARRQMELEGYELTMRAAEISFRIRREVNGHPLISKYFSVATPAQMVPDAFRASGIKDYGRPHSSWKELLDSWDQRRVRARSHAADAHLRQRRFRRHAVQGPPRGAVRHSGQQDVAQQHPAADQHQQHPQRRRAPRQGARRSVAGDRAAAARRRAIGARRLRRPRAIAHDRRAGSPQLQPVPRPVPRRPEGRGQRRPHARGVLHGLRRGQLRIREAGEFGHRQAAQGRAGYGVGQLRDSVSARASRSWCPARSSRPTRSPSCGSST